MIRNKFRNMYFLTKFTLSKFHLFFSNLFKIKTPAIPIIAEIPKNLRMFLKNLIDIIKQLFTIIII